MAAELLPKILGADVELANSMLDADGRPFEPRIASSTVLKHVCGTRPAAAGTTAASRYDIGRTWLENGGCIYIDCDHVEICTPETRSALDFTAALHAMYRIADSARAKAEAALRDGLQLELQANTSDGLGTSWGAHLNVLLSAKAWDRLFDRRLDLVLWLASYQASSLLFTGQGKAASYFDHSVDYQISQRAEFTTTVTAPQTTYDRPLVNSRGERLAGATSLAARLHCISFDSTMCHTATYLKAGVQQLIIAMIEAGIQPDVGCILRDPVRAFQRYSDDPDLTSTAPLVGGQHVTAVQLQIGFLEAAERFVQSGRCGTAVPGASEILATWRWVLEQLGSGRFEELEPHLDWLLKRHLIRLALDADPTLTWQSPEIELLDRRYADLNPELGLYFACEAGGLTNRVVTEEQIARFVTEPPSDTRASVRGGILARIPSDVTPLYVDWLEMTLQPAGAVHYRISMPEPASAAPPDGPADLRAFVRACSDAGITAVSVGQPAPLYGSAVRAWASPYSYARPAGYPALPAAPAAAGTEGLK